MGKTHSEGAPWETAHVEAWEWEWAACGFAGSPKCKCTEQPHQSLMDGKAVAVRPFCFPYFKERGGAMPACELAPTCFSFFFREKGHFFSAARKEKIITTFYAQCRSVLNPSIFLRNEWNLCEVFAKKHIVLQ